MATLTEEDFLAFEDLIKRNRERREAIILNGSFECAVCGKISNEDNYIYYDADYNYCVCDKHFRIYNKIYKTAVEDLWRTREELFDGFLNFEKE